jgi:hypothetical protein
MREPSGEERWHERSSQMGAVGGGASCDFDPAVALRRPVKDEELGESAKGARALLEKEKEEGGKWRWGITHFKLERRVRVEGPPMRCRLRTARSG